MVDISRATRGRGLVLNILTKLKIDCYSDDDLYGMYGHEKSINLEYLNIITSYTITVANFPVLWKSKLLTKKALLTM